MRIGIDASSLEGQITGVGRYVLNILNNIAKFDKENEYVLFFKNDDISKELVSQSNFKIVVIKPVIKSGFFWRNFYLNKAAKKEKINIFHFPFYTVPLVFNVPFVVTIHDIAYEANPSWFTFRARFTFKYFSRLAAKKALRIITDSNFSKEEIKKYYGIPENKIRVIYLASEKKFRDVNVDFITISKYGIVQPYFLFVGDITKRRNIDNLLKAFSMLFNERKIKSRLVIVGRKVSPSYNIEKLVNKNNLNGIVIYAGFVNDDDLIQLYANSACFVYPSLYEGFGLPVLEAMSLKVPVIASNRASIPEVTGGAAVLFDPEDIIDIADKMEKIISDAGLKKEISEKGYARSGVFSWEKAALETFNLYREVYSEITGERTRDEYKQIIEKLKTKSYPVFFIDNDRKSAIKNHLEKNNLMMNILSRSEEIIAKGKTEDVSDLITLGKAGYFSKEPRYFDMYVKELDKYLDDTEVGFQIAVNIVYSYFFLKEFDIPEYLKLKFASVLSEKFRISEEEIKDDKEYPEKKIFALFIYSFFPFLKKEDVHGYLNDILSKADEEGIISKDNLEKNVIFAEISALIAVLLLQRGVKVKEEHLKILNKMFDFAEDYSLPDNKYHDLRYKFLPVDGEKEITSEYMVFLRHILNGDHEEILSSKYVESFVFLTGNMELEEKGLKINMRKTRQLSSGYSKNKIYIMKNDINFLVTNVLSVNILSHGNDIIAKNERMLEMDDNLIVYDKNYFTNLWVAGRDYDFLDVQYELTPSLIHRRQIYFNKKENYWIIRDRLNGTEEHNIKIHFTAGAGNEVKNIDTYVNKLTVRDYVNKYSHVNKLDTAPVKLSAEDTLGVKIGKTHLLMPLNNPGITKEIKGNIIEFRGSLLLPNDIVFLICSVLSIPRNSTGVEPADKESPLRSNG